MTCNELPASMLWSYDDFAHRLPAVSLRALTNLSNSGRFPPYCRFTPHGKPFWNARQVDSYIREKMNRVASIGGDK
jgi:hypothetical protein